MLCCCADRFVNSRDQVFNDFPFCWCNLLLKRVRCWMFFQRCNRLQFDHFSSFSDGNVVVRGVQKSKPWRIRVEVCSEVMSWLLAGHFSSWLVLLRPINCWHFRVPVHVVVDRRGWKTVFWPGWHSSFLGYHYTTTRDTRPSFSR